MKHSQRKYILPILLLIGTVGLTTGIDQYIHILVCHHESNCGAKHSEDQSSEHSGQDKDHCSVCQYFTCGQNQSFSCEYTEILNNIVPVLPEKIENTNTFFTKHLDNKISRGPPAV